MIRRMLLCKTFRVGPRGVLLSRHQDLIPAGLGLQYRKGRPTDALPGPLEAGYGIFCHSSVQGYHDDCWSDIQTWLVKAEGVFLPFAPELEIAGLRMARGRFKVLPRLRDGIWGNSPHGDTLMAHRVTPLRRMGEASPAQLAMLGRGLARLRRKQSDGKVA